jgi:hypothetical protein
LNSRALERPECLSAWTNRDINKVKHELLDNINAKYYLNYNSCNIEHSSLILSGKGSLAWWPHFPHVAEYYFFFFSSLLWQRQAFNLKENEYACAFTISIDENNRAWDPKAESQSSTAWLNGLFQAVEDQIHIKTFQPQRCIESEIQPKWPKPQWPPAWFLHPSDGLILGDLILQEDVCKYHNQHEQLISNGLNIMILNRRVRGISHIDDIVHHLTNISINNKTVLQVPSDCCGNQQIFPTDTSYNHVLATDFENQRFLYQVKSMRAADVIITTHGAALTNIAFMKPCSIIIEIFPFAYHKPEYFGSLAEKLNLLRYHWQETYGNTLYQEQILMSDHGNISCWQILKNVISESGYQDDVMKRLEEENYAQAKKIMSKVNDHCFRSKYCESCFNGMNEFVMSVKPSISKIDHKLHRAIIQRKRCIRSNPYYNAQLNYSYYFHQDIEIQDGMLVRGNTRSVYLVEEGFLKPFSGIESFAKRGYDFSNVVGVHQSYLDHVPIGDTLT